MLAAIIRAHRRRERSARRFKRLAEEYVNTPVVQSMKKYTHHGRTTLYDHSVHVAYYNYLICKRLGLDYKAALKGGLLHDMFLYDWHDYTPLKSERLHGFEHPNKALKNAKDYFGLTEKEGDIIVKHMFPLTLTLPKYKETVVIILTDKFCSICEVIDGKMKKGRPVHRVRCTRHMRMNKSN